ncbi:hypothetical protein ACIOWG_15540 [Streptomyces sp. NPDC087658]|uniref:hypothetical protein n=1 Tax=Streptomyces sp. NPDC087658 TaxID=3365800 RepID=UPI00382C8C09
MNPTPKTQTPEPETAEEPKSVDPKVEDAETEDSKTADLKAEGKAEASSEDSAPAVVALDKQAEKPDEKQAGTSGEASAEPEQAKDLADDGLSDDGLSDDGLDEDLDADDVPVAASSGLGAAAAAIVAVCLGIVALTGTWSSRVLAERQGLVGQLKTGQSGTAEQQIAAIYGDAWHLTATVNGVVALVALLVGVIVLTLPERATWVRPVALAGVVLGFLGLLVSAGMYFDLFAALPTAPTAGS